MSNIIYAFNEDFSIVQDKLLFTLGGTDQFGRLSHSGVSLFANPMVLEQSTGDRTTVNRLIFDKSLYTANGGINYILNNITDEEAKTTFIENLSDVVFNILEIVKYNADSTTIETLLSGTGYVAESLAMSAAEIQENVELIQSSDTTELRDIPYWVKFTCEVDTHSFTIQVFLKESSFKELYPYTVLGPVIYPIDIEFLRSIVENGTPVTLGTFNSASIMNAIHNNDYGKDYTGFYICESYFGDTGVRLSFGVYYNGHVPTHAEANLVVANSLNDRDFWIDVLPDLFTTESFFYIPLYNNTFTPLNSTLKIYPCTCPVNTALSDVLAVFDSIDETYLISNLTLLQPSGPDLYMSVVPSYSNTVGKTKITDLYPDYLRDSSPSGNIPYMSAKTAEYMQLLSQYTVTARNATSTTNIQTLFGLEWYTFAHNGAAHHILKSTEYAQLHEVV